jgi:hypothetical protein
MWIFWLRKPWYYGDKHLGEVLGQIWRKADLSISKWAEGITVGVTACVPWTHLLESLLPCSTIQLSRSR